jgi:hypothetical protein
MSCVTPPVHPNPLLDNQIVSDIQNDLADLSWLDNIYPLVTSAEITIADNRVIVPVVYGQDNNNNYIKPFPDSRERSGCFFEIPDGTFEWDARADGMIEVEIRIIFWANLNRLISRTYDFTDELIASVMKNLKAGSQSSYITGITIEKDKDKIMPKYGYTMKQFKSFMYPMTAFAVSVRLNVEDTIDCITITNFNESYSPC